MEHYIRHIGLVRCNGMLESEISEVALLLLGRDELIDMRDNDGGAELTCHFCNNRYDVSAAELQELVKDAKGSVQSPKSVDYVEAIPE